MLNEGIQPTSESITLKGDILISSHFYHPKHTFSQIYSHKASAGTSLSWPTPSVNTGTGTIRMYQAVMLFKEVNLQFCSLCLRGTTFLFAAQIWSNQMEDESIRRKTWALNSDASVYVDAKIRGCVRFKRNVSGLERRSRPVAPSKPPWRSTVIGKWTAVRTMRNSWNKWVCDEICVLKLDAECDDDEINIKVI